MKIVVALDSFKGSLTAVQACTLVAEAIRAAMPGADVVIKPMADGGEGTAAALMAAAGGEWVASRVMGPLPEMQVDAGFAWLAGVRTAVVEMATASGLTLLSLAQQDPLKTTTYGTGQLVKAAVEHGAERILLAVGGSATVDGGVGAAMALGWRFLDREGRDVPLGGGSLARIAQIIPPPDLKCNPQSAIHNPQLTVPVHVLCDVDNPLCGEHGAARVFGPQKGATPERVEVLEAGLAHLADMVKDQLGRDIIDLPGAGAAGGLAAGAVAFMKARLVSGIDEVMSQSRLAEDVADADWVITGEGRFDAQSLRGKVVSGVARVAREKGARVAVLAGQVLLPPALYHASGVEIALACMTDSMELHYAIAHSETLLAQAAERWVRAVLSS